jgi:hypothetical protein
MGWSFLASFGGASIAVAIITQFIKDLFKRIPTQLVSYVVALIILILSTAATNSARSWSDWALVPLNAVLVSLSSNGAYHLGVKLSANQSTEK